WTQKALAGKDLWVTMKTSEGDIYLHLFSKETPKTVANFVGLATGEKQWRDPRTGKTSTAKAYDDIIFHRVIKAFMIQGGDPTGTGTGDPGYSFPDEPNGKKFDKVGLLAMANRGPNTNGMQWFITVSTPHHLDGKHIIFGEVVSGYDVVEKISKVPSGAESRDRPNTPVVLKSVVVSDKLPKGVKPPAGQ
ncbi:MAG TPA: peptidylprolyl isomerase, partial [Myxococcaceae bacterium]|nr:peptidylprolyl isomerase [Myxococcaceae bacterium]